MQICGEIGQHQNILFGSQGNQFPWRCQVIEAKFVFISDLSRTINLTRGSTKIKEVCPSSDWVRIQSNKWYQITNPLSGRVGHQSTLSTVWDPTETTGIICDNIQIIYIKFINLVCNRSQHHYIGEWAKNNCWRIEIRSSFAVCNKRLLFGISFTGRRWGVDPAKFIGCYWLPELICESRL